MSVSAFLAELHRRDIQVWSDGDHLRCNAPSGAVTPALRDELRARKRDIVEFLRSAHALSQQARAIVPLQPTGRRRPVFAVGGHNGDVFCYRALARRLGDDQPFFGLEPPGLDGHSGPLRTVDELATYFAGQIRAFQPAGPCAIAGYCAGGTIAFELARQLLIGGQAVGAVTLFAGRFPTWFRAVPQLRHRFIHYADRAAAHARALVSLPPGEGCRYLAGTARRLTAHTSAARRADSDAALILRRKVQDATMIAIRHYTPQYFPGRLNLILPSKRARRSAEGLLRWRTLARNVDEYCGPDGCEGDAMLLEPHVATIAEIFRRCSTEENAHAHLT